MPAPYQLNAAPISAPPPPFPAAAPLAGKFVTLQPLADEQPCFDELYARSHGSAESEAVWDYMPYGPFADAAAMRACYRDMAAGGDPQFYVVLHNGSGARGGIVSYLRIAPAAYSIEIGHIWHAREFQRGRANTEASCLLMGSAFKQGYRRLEWKCNALNDKSRRAALRLGLAFEGIFRQQTVFKGKNRDTAWFALIDKDWPAAQENFNQWCAADAGACSLAALNLPLVQWSLAAHDSNR